jgi:hypothetical protein
MMKEDVEEREECVFAALETGARLRGREARASTGGEAANAVDRTIATIEAESARMKAHDLSAMEAVFTSQALALDTLFINLARGATYDAQLWPEPLRLALRAQSQSRATLTSLLSLINARAAAAKREKPRNSDEQTDGNGHSQA